MKLIFHRMSGSICYCKKKRNLMIVDPVSDLYDIDLRK